jgi:cob(I)alamin adenosyltransferase
MPDRNAKVTTRTGDDGYTGLLGDARVPKWDPRIEVLGAIDEATSALGLARAQATEPDVRAAILDLQRDLYLLMGELATPPENYEQVGLRITADHLARLDGQLESFKARVQIGNQFIIPGATVGGAALDLARTIVRRGERAVASLLHDGTIANRDTLRFLNRASDLLFVLARFEEHGHSDLTKSARREPRDT